MIKFFHLIFGTTFFGMIIAAFFYISNSIQQRDRALINYSLKASYYGDGLIGFIVIFQFISAINLAVTGHFTMTIPWIFVAYHAFGFLIFLWMSILFIKIFYLSSNNNSPTALKIYYLLNFLIILIFILIIHDAVTQSTWFDFLFRK